MQMAMEDAESAEQLGYINAHGTSTVNDPMESAVIRKVWANTQITCLSAPPNQ